jgi:hypothetical protein
MTDAPGDTGKPWPLMWTSAGGTIPGPITEGFT